MSETALIVVVTAAQTPGRVQDAVRELRQRFDASAALGVPPHVTVLYPFMPPDRIDSKVITAIRDAVADILPFDFTLAHAARFAATAYLAPEPAAPFVRLTRAIVRAFPNYPAYAGEHADIEPHLTVAHGNADDAEVAHATLTAAIQECGPIQSVCDALVLIENTSGRWAKMHVFPLHPDKAGHS